MELEIREAQAADAVMLTFLLRQLFDDQRVAVLPERLDEIKVKSDNFIYLAEQKQTIVGMIQMTLCPDIMFKQQPYAVLENVIVSSDARGLGVGKLLMEAVERKCLEEDCSKIMLLSSATRFQAHQFFEANGYSSDIKKGFVKYRRSFNQN